MKLLLPRRNFAHWIFGLAVAIGGSISAGAHLLHNYQIKSEDTSMSMGIFIVVIYTALMVISIGYPRSMKGRLFYDAVDGAKGKFLVESDKFTLSLHNLLITDDRIATILMDWDFKVRKIAVDSIGHSSSKNEAVYFYVDIVKDSTTIESFEFPVTNARTSGPWPRTDGYKESLGNIIEIDSREIEGCIDIIFRDFSFHNDNYEPWPILFTVKVEIDIAASRRSNPVKSVGSETKFEVLNS